MSISAEKQPREVFHHSAGAVVIQDGSCLALRRGREWVFPKGHLERGETAAEAAIREVREETGIDVQLDGELGSTRYEFRGAGNSRNRKRVDWFLAQPVGGTLSAERIFGQAAWMTRAEAQELITHEADRDLARRAFELEAEQGH